MYAVCDVSAKDGFSLNAVQEPYTGVLCLSVMFLL